MKNIKKVKMLIDIIMPILLVTLMAYQLIGRAYHEYAGTVLFLIFIVHNILNIKWYPALFKGKYSPYRVLNTVINIAILIIMVLLMISGIIMSEYTFSFLGIKSGTAYARLIHLSASNWGYVLMSIHLGMHLGLIFGKRFNYKIGIVLTAISIYGIYVFCIRKIWSYMFLINQFAFFNNSESVFKFILDYFAIMVLFALAGYMFSEFTKNLSKKYY